MSRLSRHPNHRGDSHSLDRIVKHLQGSSNFPETPIIPIIPQPTRGSTCLGRKRKLGKRGNMVIGSWEVSICCVFMQWNTDFLVMFEAQEFLGMIWFKLIVFNKGNKGANSFAVLVLFFAKISGRVSLRSEAKCPVNNIILATPFHQSFVVLGFSGPLLRRSHPFAGSHFVALRGSHVLCCFAMTCWWSCRVAGAVPCKQHINRKSHWNCDIPGAFKTRCLASSLSLDLQMQQFGGPWDTLDLECNFL